MYVSTDSDKIKEVVEGFRLDKVQVIGRSFISASDTVPTESVMFEFAANCEFDNIVLIQATAPLLTPEDLSGGFCEFNKSDIDSVSSVVRQKRFQWVRNQDGFATTVNYDIFQRPRRQEFDGFLVENGAFYITSRRVLLQSGNRLSGKIQVYEMMRQLILILARIEGVNG